MIWNPLTQGSGSESSGDSTYFEKVQGWKGGVLPPPPSGYWRMTGLGGITPAGAKPFVTERRCEQTETKGASPMPE